MFYRLFGITLLTRKRDQVVLLIYSAFTQSDFEVEKYRQKYVLHIRVYFVYVCMCEYILNKTFKTPANKIILNYSSITILSFEIIFDTVSFVTSIHRLSLTKSNSIRMLT